MTNQSDLKYCNPGPVDRALFVFWAQTKWAGVEVGNGEAVSIKAMNIKPATHLAEHQSRVTDAPRSPRACSVRLPVCPFCRLI